MVEDVRTASYTLAEEGRSKRDTQLFGEQLFIHPNERKWYLPCSAFLLNSPSCSLHCAFFIKQMLTSDLTSHLWFFILPGIFWSDLAIEHPVKPEKYLSWTDGSIA